MAGFGPPPGCTCPNYYELNGVPQHEDDCSYLEAEPEDPGVVVDPSFGDDWDEGDGFDDSVFDIPIREKIPVKKPLDE